MPFRSEKQRRFMYARHPGIARRWTKKYGSAIQGKDAMTKLAGSIKRSRKKNDS